MGSRGYCGVSAPALCIHGVGERSARNQGADSEKRDDDDDNHVPRLGHVKVEKSWREHCLFRMHAKQRPEIRRIGLRRSEACKNFGELNSGLLPFQDERCQKGSSFHGLYSVLSFKVVVFAFLANVVGEALVEDVSCKLLRAYSESKERSDTEAGKEIDGKFVETGMVCIPPLSSDAGGLVRCNNVVNRLDTAAMWHDG